MLLNPDALAKAQAEIDAIIGPDRLPGVQDRQSLPYVNALIKEVLRFEPVTPMGLLHSTTDDDVFEGCFIPKGTQIIPNIWSETG
jgi:cytochrome P450